MKKLYAFLLPLLLIAGLSSAQTRYWVGAPGGNWNNTANWSTTSGGAGGASVPGSTNDVVFNSNASVNVDLTSITISSLLVTGGSKTVALYTATGTSITVSPPSGATYGLKVDATNALIDSTAGDVGFDMNLTPGGAPGQIDGLFRLAGQVPIINGTASNLNVPAGSLLNVTGQVVVRPNTGVVDATASSLTFAAGSTYSLERDGGTVPRATYDPLSTIVIAGSINSLPNISGTPPSLGNLTINLPLLADDVPLDLPTGTLIKGDLQILNTNNHILTLLKNEPDTPNNTVTVNKNLVISGTSNVALSTDDAAAPGRNYRLQVNQNFTQTNGSFSLQDLDATTSTTTFAVKGNVSQTAGTFVTRSTATSTSRDLFILELNGTAAQTVDLLNNTQNNLTLRMNNTSAGASLSRALRVGRLNLTSGVLSTTSTNLLTINDADPVFAVRNGSTSSFVSGPLVRPTNSTLEYLFPTGKGSVYDPISLFPSTTTPTTFQAEYFNTGFPDRSVLVPLSGVSDAEYWTLNRVSGAANGVVELRLNAPVPGASSGDGIVVARYNGADWVSEKGTTGNFVTPGNSSSGAVVSQIQTTFGNYTFGYAPVSALPLRFITFDGRKLNGGASLEWKVSEQPEKFEVWHSSNGTDFTLLGVVDGVVGKTSYTFFDGNLTQGVNYYRIRSIEKDGSSNVSRVIPITNKVVGLDITAMAPTLVVDKAKLLISSEHGGTMDLTVTDITGRVWKKLRIAVSPGNSSPSLDLATLVPGTYHITGYMNGVKTRPLAFIKQ